MAESTRLRTYYAVSRAAFRTAYGLAGLRRDVIRSNLARSFPDRSPEARRAIEHEFVLRQSELAAEVAYAFRIGPAELRERIEITDMAPIADAAAPRPHVVAMAHHCNFEWLLLRVSLEFGERLLGLYKPMHSARAEAAFRRMRTRFGARLIPAKSVLQQLARNRDVALVGLVADQVPRSSPECHWTGFLGQDTAFYMGPELLGRALRSRVLYARMGRLERGRYRVSFEVLSEAGTKAPPGTITERYAAALERQIRDDPAGWWWSHKRWKLARTAQSG